MAHQNFVDIHYDELIDRVISVMAIADRLYGKNMLFREKYSEIRNITNVRQEKMRILLDVVKSGGPKVKSFFYEVLKLNEPYLVEDLENKSEILEPSGKPESGGIVRWNSISIKHSDTIKKFQEDSSKRKFGNIYFSKDKNYIIGFGSCGIQVYLGLKEDGTEVAIKRIMKTPLNTKRFENELKHLQDLKLESKNIVRYVDFAEDEDFFYLALQLCECDLEKHLQDLQSHEQEEKDTALKKMVCDILLGLQLLHHAQVIHRDIKPTNVLIDSENNARLADFGLSRKLEECGSTVNTVRAGSRGWEAVETLDPSGHSEYKMSSDIQVAGILVYYILSDRKHPFGVNGDQETNIREGKFSLIDVCDVAAKDLIKRMININPAHRPTIDKVLQHPFFWDDIKKDTVFRKVGDREEVQFYESLKQIYNLCNPMENGVGGKQRTLHEAIQHVLNQIPNSRKRDQVKNGIQKTVGEDQVKLQNLCDTVKKHSEAFSTWKKDLSEIWTFSTDINRNAPEDFLGLFRFLRNKLVHEKDKFDKNKMLTYFPDFFIHLYGLAEDLNWEF